jgi:hypothetical protein
VFDLPVGDTGALSMRIDVAAFAKLLAGAPRVADKPTAA